MKKVMLFVPDGTGIKNYLYSNTFKNVKTDLCLAHNFNSKTVSEIKEHVAITSEIVIPEYSEGIKEKYYRELIHKCRIDSNMELFDNPTIQKFYKPKKSNWKTKAFYTAIEMVAKKKQSYSSILALEARYQDIIRMNPFYKKVKTALEKEKPEVLFCTHQRAINTPCLFAAAKDLGITTITVIYSWDNIPKARLALRADQYLVWSQLMQEELLLAYPEIDASQIHITGSPQFEFYLDSKNIIARDSFYRNYKLDENRKLICFSGDDVRTSPDDPMYLRDLAEQLTKAGKECEYQIVFRRCPVDVSGRYQEVIAAYPELIVEMPPLWNVDGVLWSAVYPTYEDVNLLVSLAYYCHVVVNVGSTMAFDFGMFNKPCIFINYNQDSHHNWSTETIYNYQHFKSMPSLNAVHWWNEKEAIISVLEATVSSKETTIQKWQQKILNHSNDASTRIKKVIGI